MSALLPVWTHCDQYYHTVDPYLHPESGPNGYPGHWGESSYSASDALGVGIGVDYGIYIFSKVKEALGQGKPLHLTYLYALNATGKAVAFTGVTLAIGVATWVFSPIKFQADMGLLLTFMFLFNMLGALTLIPAIAWLLRIGPDNYADEECEPMDTEAVKVSG